MFLSLSDAIKDYFGREGKSAELAAVVNNKILSPAAQYARSPSLARDLRRWCRIALLVIMFPAYIIALITLFSCVYLADRINSSLGG
jgi:hypothetical protein